MSVLDNNLFTLKFSPSQDDPTTLDLVDRSGVIHYRKLRAQDSLYEINVYDPTSDSLLITASAASPTSKTKVLQLHNPSSLVELKSVSRVTFRWSFKWEDHEFEWKKDECHMIRKPDPPVLVAVTSEPPGRMKTGSVQIMDYNLNRFDINDRKGLEILMLTALFTFQDMNEAYRSPPPYEEVPSTSIELSIPLLRTRKSFAALPVRPPKPEPRTGIDRIAEMQSYKGEVNEVMVEEEGSIDDYGKYCWNLLEDDAMLFITIRSSTAADVPKVLHVVEQTKRIKHKANVSDNEELFQYVVYDQEKSKESRQRINLDDDNHKPTEIYTPPTSITIHLSKIDIPELRPRLTADKGREKVNGKRYEVGKGHDQEREHTKEKERPKDKDKKKKEKKKTTKGATIPNPVQLANPSGYGNLARPDPPRASSLPGPSTPASLNSNSKQNLQKLSKAVKDKR